MSSKKNTEGRGFAAFMLLMGGNFAEAEKAFTQLIAADPKKVRHYVDRALAREQLGNLKDAILDLEHALGIADSGEMKKQIRDVLSDVRKRERK
jgi:regulator of sirC expression with transglutaminase-like and TPR domain